MSFQWQDREVAAGTLGVDVGTLQAWIDDGRAPSRTHGGKVQVLIELLDEEEVAEEAAATTKEREAASGTSKNGARTDSNRGGSADAPASATSASSARDQRIVEEDTPAHERVTGNGSGGTADHGTRTTREHDHAPTEIDVVSKRELQLAGGMVAAWQRLAETTGEDLSRARKLSAVSWSLVAVLVIISGVGLWWTTQQVTETRGRNLTLENKLKEATGAINDSQTTITGLRSEITQRNSELTQANTDLAKAIERASLTKEQADALAAQHQLTKQLADKQAATAETLAATLQKTIDQQTARISAMEQELKDARRIAAELPAQVAGAKKQTEEAAARRDELQSQLDALKTDHAKAQAQVGELQKQIAELKDALKKAEKQNLLE